MPITQEQLDNFHRFATDRLNNGGGDLSWQELLELWSVENPSPAEQAEVLEIIRRGERDVQSGNYRSLDEFVAEFRAKQGSPDQ